MTLSETYTWDVEIQGAGTGACCVGTVCSIKAQADCTGTYKGDGTTCSPNPCVSGGCSKPDCNCTDKTTCETAGCYWYSYPNPFGTPTCHNAPIYIQYLPFIAGGVAVAIIAVALLSSRKGGFQLPMQTTTKRTTRRTSPKRKR